jgi:hypothetical protein
MLQGKELKYQEPDKESAGFILDFQTSQEKDVNYQISECKSQEAESAHFTYTQIGEKYKLQAPTPEQFFNNWDNEHLDKIKTKIKEVDSKTLQSIEVLKQLYSQCEGYEKEMMQKRELIEQKQKLIQTINLRIKVLESNISQRNILESNADNRGDDNNRVLINIDNRGDDNNRVLINIDNRGENAQQSTGVVNIAQNKSQQFSHLSTLLDKKSILCLRRLYNASVGNADKFKDNVILFFNIENTPGDIEKLGALHTQLKEADNKVQEEGILKEILDFICSLVGRDAVSKAVEAWQNEQQNEIIR